MITIHCNRSLGLPSAGGGRVRVANSIADYIPLRQWLRDALDDPDPVHEYVVYLQSRLLQRWLDDLREYDSSTVRWIEGDLREEFRDKYGRPLPNEVPTEAVQPLELLSLAPPRIDQDDTGWILAQKLGLVWETPRPNKGHMAELAVWLASGKPIARELLDLAKKRLETWQVFDEHYGLLIALDPARWQGWGRALLLRGALHAYPDRLALARQWAQCPDVNCSAQTEALRSLLDEHEVRTELGHFWGMWQADPQSDVRKALGWMSGLSSVELRVFVQYAQRHADLLDASLLLQARQRFSALPEAHAMLEKLQDLIPPPHPRTPDQSWNASTMLSWVRSEYMPYLGWILRTKQPREEQMALAVAFSSWLVQQYPTMLYDDTAPIVTNQRRRVEEHLQCEGLDVVFWFVLDGMTWWQALRLLELSRQHRWGVQHFEPVISALPSITEVSKRALLEGCLRNEPLNGNLMDLAAKTLQGICPQVCVRSGHNDIMDTLQEPLDKKVYVFFYNDLDSYNHTSHAWTDDSVAKGHVGNVVELIDAAFAQCQRQGRRTSVLVHSDHGCTLLPTKPEVVQVTSGRDAGAAFGDEAEGISGPDPRHRYCWQPKAVATPEGCYRLDANSFLLPRDAVVPQGYAAMGRRPKGWTHGGLTPEEVVTAYLELRPEPVPWLDLRVILAGELRPREASTIKVSITNGNATPIENVRLLLDNRSSSAWPSIGAYSTVDGDLRVQIIQSALDTAALKWQLSYVAEGVEHHAEGSSLIRVRRLQSRSEADELLGGL